MVFDHIGYNVSDFDKTKNFLVHALRALQNHGSSPSTPHRCKPT